MNQRPFYLGIDLGTTNSAAAVFDGEQLTAIRNAQGSVLTPSVVRIDGKGGMTIGGRAAKFLESDPRNTRSEFKRLMGTATKIDFAASKKSLLPEELSAEVLRSLRADVRDQLGFLPEQAVISVPALFELPQSAATSEAAKQAGFKRVELIQEPIASALAAGWTTSEGSGYWLVYDLGGGTFDASLLETKDGLLRVVGHDGDNFLGGRDFDWAIVDWALTELEREQGVKLSRAEPAHAAAVRKLKRAAEEAKIELTRSERAEIAVPELIEIDGSPIELSLALDRAKLESLTLPLVERSLAVCKRLLAEKDVSALSRIVMVGGPTMMPWLRRLVNEVLRAPLAEGLDPMTLVAQGAAIYAATSNLDARPVQATAARGFKLWLQYPTMSSDLQPYVVGRLYTDKQTGTIPTKLRLHRGDDLWQSPEVVIDPEGGFVVQVELIPRRPNVFRLEGMAEGGEAVALEPQTITIVQGLTISDPPLSRTIGVALAHDLVQVYFEKGTPLPARRTSTHYTVETVAPVKAGTPGHDFALKIPIVQGEYGQAHLCRLVGTLEIRSSEVKGSLPAGSAVEVSLEVDRGGQLSARALVPTLSQVFEQVAHLLVPEATPATLTATLEAMRDRLATLRTEAFAQRQAKSIGYLGRLEQTLAELERDLAAARGGDADAAQKARRTLLELDGELEQLEFGKRFPEVVSRAQRTIGWAGRWVAMYGTPTEQRLLGEVGTAIEKAANEKDMAELERQHRLASDLGNAAYFRHPDVWVDEFDSLSGRIDNATDLVRAKTLVDRGRAARQSGDKDKLRDVVEQLWTLMPVDRAKRQRGFDSGVR